MQTTVRNTKITHEHKHTKHQYQLCFRCRYEKCLHNRQEHNSKLPEMDQLRAHHTACDTSKNAWIWQKCDNITHIFTWCELKSGSNAFNHTIVTQWHILKASPKYNWNRRPPQICHRATPTMGAHLLTFGAPRSRGAFKHAETEHTTRSTSAHTIVCTNRIKADKLESWTPHENKQHSRSLLGHWNTAGATARPTSKPASVPILKQKQQYVQMSLNSYPIP